MNFKSEIIEDGKIYVEFNERITMSEDKTVDLLRDLMEVVNKYKHKS